MNYESYKFCKKNGYDYYTPYKQLNIYHDYDSYQVFKKELNIIEVNPIDSGYINSVSAYYYNTPHFKGYVTTDNNIYTGQHIKKDRIENITDFNNLFIDSYTYLIGINHCDVITINNLDSALYSLYLQDLKRKGLISFLVCLLC